MEKFEIVTAGRVYANQMANHVRASDVMEVYRASGQDIRTALLDSVDASDDDMCWAALLNGLPVAMFGANSIAPVGDEDASVGGIWLLATPGILTNRLDFMRHCKKYLAVMHERYEFLTNYVDVDNVTTLCWLPRLGFRFGPTVVDYGFAKTPFVQVVSKRT